MGPRVVSKASQFDFNRDPLYGDERMRFLLINDTTVCKGLNLFKAFLKLYCKADINVAIFCCDGPVEDLECGLNLKENKKLIIDEFTDSQESNHVPILFRCDWKKLSSFEGLVCIYSLTSILIQNTEDEVYRAFYSMLNNNPKLHILALMHRDVHSLKTNDILCSLATSVINISPTDGSTKFELTMSTKNKSFGQICYEYQLSPSFSFEIIKVAPSKCNKVPSKKPDPTANLTFNLNLKEGEKEVRSQLQMPYAKVQTVDSVTSQNLEDDYYEDEDPDDDLGFLEAI